MWLNNNKRTCSYFLLLLILLYVSLKFNQVLAEIGVVRIDQEPEKIELIQKIYFQKLIISPGIEAISITNLDEFEKFIKDHFSVLVLFYAYFSYWSRLSLPEFDAASQMLSHHEPPVALVKVDSAAGGDILKKYNITDFPTYKFFMDGEPHSYTASNGFRTTIVHWIDNKLNRDKMVTSNSYLDTLMKNLEVHNIVIGALPTSVDATDFIHVARECGDDTFFGYLQATNVIDYFMEKYLDKTKNVDLKNLKPPFIIIFDRYENNVELYRESLNDRHAIQEFVRRHEFPVVVRFDNDWASKLFSDGRSICVLLLDINEEEKNREYQDQFKKVAVDYRGFLLFTVSQNYEMYEKRLLSLLGAEEDVLPVVRIVTLDINSGGHYNRDKKYKPETLTDGSFNEQGLRSFIDSFNRKALKPYLKSEMSSDANNYDGPVRVAVGLTFDNIVRNSEQNVLITLYAPWCGHCRKLEPEYKELALRLNGIKDIVIAKIDATRNEIKNLFYRGFPTIYLFPKGNKDNPILYQGNRSVEDMMNFINDYTDLNLNVDMLMNADLKLKKNGKESNNDFVFEEL